MTETAIHERGLIGDLQTAALVTTDGAVDWFNFPQAFTHLALIDAALTLDKALDRALNRGTAR